MDLNQIIHSKLDVIKDVRKTLHENAEIGFNEYKTKKIVEDFIHNLNVKTQTVAKTGVVAILNEGVECVAIRADMDALPVNGVSHVCGHDYHMAVALGVCQALKDINYKKCIKFIFQPAEEGAGGAIPMINEGVMENPLVKNVIGFHVWPEVKVGTIEVAPGPSMGSIDDFTFTFKGKGGHAAMPHKCINPIYPAIDFIDTITIKSRIEHDPQSPHILTISSIQSGKVCNVIEDKAKVLGTVRTFNNKQRITLQEEIVKTAKLCAEKYSCEVDTPYNSLYPPLQNDKDFTEKFINITKKLIGKDNVLPLEKTFASEDFAFFAEKVPSVHFRLGIDDGVKGTHPLHSPNFDANEDALFYGIYVIVNFILSM